MLQCLRTDSAAADTNSGWRRSADLGDCPRRAHAAIAIAFNVKLLTDFVFG